MLRKGMFDIIPTDITGLVAVEFTLRTDPRGFFVKTLHADSFREAGLPLDFRESYYSLSNRNVLRGFHFQVPPEDHDKFVYCVDGCVLDVVVDLRQGSSTYGNCVSRELDGRAPSGFVIPKGCGHAFLTLTDQAMLVYNVTTAYSPQHDCGVLWNTVDFDWPIVEPLLSDRDRSFPSLSEFASPFS